jgi:glycopeptide antibiotics resistance protein
LSTFFVILYNVTVITTEKLAKAGVCNLFIGTWGAILVMIPFALFFYYCAKKDKKIFGRG